MNFIFFSVYLILAIILFIYSYGFVDFNLTLSSHPAVMNFISWSQRLAMFNRPISIYVYLAIIGVFYLLYLLFLSKKKQLSVFPWKPIGLLALILALSYPLLSSDVFKYLFAAKELLVYHTNPHLVAPQVFEGDTWLRFMRWIHTPSPYGPIMTALVIPYYLLGLGKFTPSLYMFKLDQAFWYLLTIWLIGKLATKLKLTKQKTVLAQLFFALNPLVLIEWLVNAHNDAPMIALLLLSLYLLSSSRRLLSFVTLALSIGIKYVTVIFLPLIIFKKPKTTLQHAIYYLLILLTFIPYFYHYSSQFQPWYITWLVPFTALTLSPTLFWLVGAYSLGGLIRYFPFISTGLWEGTPQYIALITYLPLIVVSVGLLSRHIIRRSL
ncbi:MAG: hypothetical protein ABII80_02840 [bacterium]